MNNRQKRYKHNEIRPIAQRALAFSICFIIASAFLGLHIMHLNLFWRYGFQWYAGAGKGLLFAAIAFLIIVWRREDIPKLGQWSQMNFAWLVASLCSFLFAWRSTDQLNNAHNKFLWSLAAHCSIILMVILLALFVFGLDGLKTIYKSYKRELGTSVLIGAAFVAFLYLVYSLWSVLASIVISCVRALFRIVNIQTAYISPRTILFNKFSITIAEGCSGIDSIALFSAMYALIGVLDWQRFNHTKYLYIFVPALLVLFGFNILRVFVLILAGYYINPQIAFSLFHTYAGLVFFVIFSAIFWWISYGWMQKERET